MRITRFFSFTLMFFFILSLFSCGNPDGIHPIDNPNTRWGCSEIQMEFTITETGIKDAILVDKNGVSIDAIVSLNKDDNKMIVKNAETNETIFQGECTFKTDAISVTISDSFGSNFDHIPILINFRKTDD